MYFTAAFVASLVLAVNSLATPQVEAGLNRRHHHAALAKARAPVPEPEAQPLSAAIPKRQIRKRCKNRKSSSLAASSTEASSAAASPSDAAPVNVAPLPTTSSAPAPTSKASPKPKPTEDPAPAPAPSSGGGISSSIFSGNQVGEGTFYGTGLGACGITNSDTDMIAAVSLDLFDKYPGYNGANPNQNPLCNKKVKVTYQGKSVVVALTDRCTGCAPTDLDFSPAAFNKLADPALGRIYGVKWTWLD